MKILHIVHSFHYGGLENGVVNLINNLDPEHYEHEICCVSISGGMAERLLHETRIHELRKSPTQRAYSLPLQLARLINSVRPDIVHTRNWGTIDGIIGARLAGVKKIIHGEHGREAMDPKGRNKWRNRFRRITSPAVSRYVALSKDLYNWLVRDVGIASHKIVRIINGVDTAKFHPPGNVREIREKSGLPVEGPLIGVVGRLDPVKDHETLLKAVAPLSMRAHLAVIGDGPQREHLQKTAGDLGISPRVVFLGDRKDIPELLQALDIFVLPSIAEGISNTILEAMACGLPIIASNVGGNPELISNGETGLLFTAGDHGELSDKIESYLRNPEPRKIHGASARKAAVENFSLAAMVNNYDRLYQSI